MTASSKTRTILRLANRAIRHISWILALTPRREGSGGTFRQDSGLAPYPKVHLISVIGKVEASTRTFALRPGQQVPFMLMRDAGNFCVHRTEAPGIK